MDFLIEKEHDGTLVLDFLRREIGLSSAMLRHLKYLPDGICVDGAHVTVRHRLAFGETLTIKSEDTDPSENIVPSNIALDVVYEDSELVVPDKPPYMPTHPSHGHFDDTVANALAYRYKDSGAFVFRPINRLDRNTSGLVLIARNRMAAAHLSMCLRNGKIEKEYLAVLCGTLPERRGVIDTYIKREAESIITRKVCGSDEGGDRAITRYEVVYADGKNTVVKAVPVTGRTHQLRVHFSYLGAPIAGDDMYGESSELIGRHALHARRLCFTHPSGNRLELVSPLPNDMRSLIEVLFDEDGQSEIYSKIL